MSQTLLRNKLDALQSGEPERIVTANVGCQMHLASEASVPVQHWLELVDSLLQEGVHKQCPGHCRSFHPVEMPF